jgi:hypothetical protein
VFTIWRTLKVPKEFFTPHHGSDVNRATKGIINTTLILKSTVVSEVIVATM